MIKTIFITLALWIFCTLPAHAQPKSDYLTQDVKKLPQRTFEIPMDKTVEYGDRTAGGSKKKARVKKSKKQRREARRERARQKKIIERFGTFNQ
ncbi:MAG TPA: hypothetical protein VHP34_02895 [Alphaproteobacteria bacterium]|jgi:hypothetical protein|nr:hypothetical protein [Alphaproteobacteria bacterium]